MSRQDWGGSRTSPARVFGRRREPPRCLSSKDRATAEAADDLMILEIPYGPALKIWLSRLSPWLSPIFTIEKLKWNPTKKWWWLTFASWSTGIILLLHLGIGAMECPLATENIWHAFWRFWIPMVFKGVFWLPGNARLKLVGDLSWPNPARTCFFPSTWLINSPFTRHSSPHRGWSRSVERYWDPWAATWTPWTLNISIFKKLTFERTAHSHHHWKNCTCSGYFSVYDLRPIILKIYKLHTLSHRQGATIANPFPWVSWIRPARVSASSPKAGRLGDLFIFWSHRMSRSNCYVSKANGVYHPQNHPNHGYKPF